MATKVVMEALSPTMEEGRLVEWKKNEGDPVRVGDVIAEVETDKAVMELVARGEGVLLRQLVPAGTTAAVASLVGVIGQPGEDISALVGGAGAAAPHRRSPRPRLLPRRPVRPATQPPSPPTGPAAPPAAPAGGRDKGLAAGPQGRPGAWARPRRHRRSGPEGRIVLARPRQGRAGRRHSRPPCTAGGGFEDVPLTQIRKTIAKRLAQSIGPMPTFYLTTEVDMERAWELREH